MENLRQELQQYIAEHYTPETSAVYSYAPGDEEDEVYGFSGEEISVGAFAFRVPRFQTEGESFSEMLLRLIAEKGGKPAQIYNRAGINRQHFYKISHNANYRPTKQTAVAFAFALELPLKKAQEFLKTAGYTLTNSSLADVIAIFFLEREIFSLDTVNQYLHENNQPLLGDWKCNLPGDQKNSSAVYNPPRNSKGGSTLKNVTEIVFILDRSGSMCGLEADTIGGFNSTLNQNKNSDADALVSTVLFDDVSEVLHDRVPIAEVPTLTSKEYFVRGNTALLDAVGDAIKHIRNVHKYAREEDRPAKTLFVITTDGMENASRRYTYDDIKKLIEEQKERGWEFLFLGANIDSVEVSGRMGISARRTVNYHNDRQGSAAKFMSTSNFVSAAMSSASFADVDDTWREVVDHDYISRKPKK